MSKLLNIIAKIKCALGFHEWIYTGPENNIKLRRYCDHCRRQEQLDKWKYYNIGKISYDNMRRNY